MIDLSSYELVWPADLFVAEAGRIAALGRRDWVSRAEWLLTEAFQGSSACSDFESLPSTAPKSDDPWGAGADPWSQAPVLTQQMWLRELIGRAQEIRQFTEPRPYWPHRNGQVAPTAPSDPVSVRFGFARLVMELLGNGYLAEHFGEECVDSDEQLPDPAEVLEQRLGVGQLWPLEPKDWDEDTFFGLVEVFHDLVSRPRDRTFHSWDGCGWHHREFHVGPARVLYRWRVNRLLAGAGVQYRLADEGEDQGRLVAVTDDARADLVHRTLAVADPDIKQRTTHAIALYRGRGASIEEKRSAVIVLAGILEERRDLIRSELGKPDDGALFVIANKFEIRHRDASQQEDYDPAFLDWIFWWYLATVELTTTLLSRQQAEGSRA
ncbi:hypothetical protein OU787_26235 [Kitasatospora sp. YST-16]|uniref:hypothetical protein n=1 Tax=Kitasatospora sp. YST-16 TaxID=2998080 RepID=UPI0022833AF1|nr:hypothetical protein [Kitasatospora sp. YST-16]WAL74686.1 hypothetical protein OU787_26235 [Kitasatospora sp. YST-16]WNW40741.1 hypothetical protein RKE32_26170 [Streptomyces sp. Li-HN-5-13]